MDTTCFLLSVLCFLAVGADSSGTRTIPAAILTVDVLQDGAFVTAETAPVTMLMNSKMTKVFRISVLCDGSVDAMCVDVESTDIGGNILAIKDTPETCFYCKRDSASFGQDVLYKNSSMFNETPDQISKFKATLINQTYITQSYTTVNVTMESTLIGVAGIEFKLANYTQATLNSTAGYASGSVWIECKVLRAPSPLDLVFMVCVYCMEIVEMFVFGTQLDLKTVKKTLRRPLFPLIGFVCQYVGMPLIAFGIAKAAISDTNSMASLGIFVAGICPGGGGSNIYTYLLGGDLSLSITMTTISTVMSLAMMPAWLYTLGQEFLDKETASIPYTDILLTLSIILIPLSIGLLLQSKEPRVTTLVQKVLTVIITVIALVLIVTGVYANLYMFQLMTLKVVFIGCALPYVGFFLGGTVALLIGLPADTVKTIAIETGMQNTGIGFLLLYNSLAEPYGDIASIAPISSEIMSPIPPLLIAIVYLIYKKYCKKYKSVPRIGEPEESSSECNVKSLDTSIDDCGGVSIDVSGGVKHSTYIQEKHVLV